MRKPKPPFDVKVTIDHLDQNAVDTALAVGATLSGFVLFFVCPWALGVVVAIMHVLGAIVSCL